MALICLCALVCAHGPQAAGHAPRTHCAKGQGNEHKVPAFVSMRPCVLARALALVQPRLRGDKTRTLGMSLNGNNATSATAVREEMVRRRMQGGLPKHLGIVMDGNRRYAKLCVFCVLCVVCCVCVCVCVFFVLHHPFAQATPVVK